MIPGEDTTKKKIGFFIMVLQHTSAPRRILNIEYNNGQLTETYAAYGKTIGIDINPEAMKQCDKRNPECIYCEIHNLDLCTYNNSFDIIIAGNIIEHIIDTDAILAKIYDFLKPSGSLLLTTPNITLLDRRVILLIGINPFIEFPTQLLKHVPRLARNAMVQATS